MYKLILSFLLLMLILETSCSFNNSSSKNGASYDTLHVSSDIVSVDSDRQYLVKVGDMAPDFEMALPDGQKVKLSSLRGKIVMLQFTASWCGVCRKEMPYIESEIWQKHKNNPNFALYGIDREEPVEKIEYLKEVTGVTYPIGLDSDASIFGLYAEKSAGITRNIIIDKDGKIAMLTRLFEEEEFNRMVSLINDLLNN